MYNTIEDWLIGKRIGWSTIKAYNTDTKLFEGYNIIDKEEIPINDFLLEDIIDIIPGYDKLYFECKDLFPEYFV